jgi:hypothetical protein
MASYYVSQAYDAPSSFIWTVLTDFPTWPAWFPRMTKMSVADGGAARRGAELMAIGEHKDEWTRWKVTEWSEPALLVCEYIDSNVPVSHGIQAAYLQFELFDDPEGCTLEIELGAEGHGLVGDFFVGMTLGTGARRILPQLVDAFSAHVVERASTT